MKQYAQSLEILSVFESTRHLAACTQAVVILRSTSYIAIELKRRRLRISRIDGQTRKIENPDNLTEEHLWGAIFENIIVIL